MTGGLYAPRCNGGKAVGEMTERIPAGGNLSCRFGLNLAARIPRGIRRWESLRIEACAVSSHRFRATDLKSPSQLRWS